MTLKDSDVKGLFSLSLIVVILVSALIGGIITYLWVMGYYVSVGFRVPEDVTTLTITNASFNPEDPTRFNLTVLNPSYSPGRANITRIAVSVGDSPQLYDIDLGGEIITIERGEAKNITCGSIMKGEEKVGWGEFAGEKITVYVFAGDASAALRQFETPLVRLHVKGAIFDSKVSVKHFNLTVQNDAESVIALEIKNVSLGAQRVENVTPSLPITLHPGESKSLRCDVDWQNHTGETPRIVVETSRGYRGVYQPMTPLPRIYLIVSDASFGETDTDYFNVTIENSAESSHYVDILGVVLKMEDGEELVLNGADVQYEVDGAWKPLTPYYRLERNSSQTFRCSWNWTRHRNEAVTIFAYTRQGFETRPPCGRPITITTPPMTILKIVGAPVFDLSDKNHFNVTVQNSPSSIEDVRVTRITVALEGWEEIVIDGEKVAPALPSPPIGPGNMAEFRCEWSWADYAGQRATVIVYAQKEECRANYTLTIPFAELNITEVLFDSTIEGIEYFNVTVKSLDYSIKPAKITRITLTIVETGDTFEIDSSVVHPDILSELVDPGEMITLVCPWRWKPFSGMEAVVTLFGEKGLMYSYTCTIGP